MSATEAAQTMMTCNHSFPDTLFVATLSNKFAKSALEWNEIDACVTYGGFGERAGRSQTGVTLFVALMRCSMQDSRRQLSRQ